MEVMDDQALRLFRRSCGSLDARAELRPRLPHPWTPLTLGSWGVTPPSDGEIARSLQAFRIRWSIGDVAESQGNISKE